MAKASNIHMRRVNVPALYTAAYSRRLAQYSGGEIVAVARPRRAVRPRDGSVGPQVYSGIKADIASGRLAAGTRLREHELGLRFRVSRTPVREALKRLLSEGFVREEAAGLTVATFTIQEIVDAYELVEAIDVLMARLAAERGSASDVANLTTILNGVDAAIKTGDLDRAAALSARFETVLRELPRNARLRSVIDDLHLFLSRMAPDTKDRKERMRARLSEHRAIVEAIAGRDPVAAEAAARTHVVSSRDLRLTSVAERQVLP